MSSGKWWYWLGDLYGNELEVVGAIIRTNYMYYLSSHNKIEKKNSRWIVEGLKKKF